MDRVCFMCVVCNYCTLLMLELTRQYRPFHSNQTSANQAVLLKVPIPFGLVLLVSEISISSQDGPNVKYRFQKVAQVLKDKVVSQNCLALGSNLYWVCYVCIIMILMFLSILLSYICLGEISQLVSSALLQSLIMRVYCTG